MGHLLSAHAPERKGISKNREEIAAKFCSKKNFDAKEFDVDV